MFSISFEKLVHVVRILAFFSHGLLCLHFLLSFSIMNYSVVISIQIIKYRRVEASPSPWVATSRASLATYSLLGEQLVLGDSKLFFVQGI